jgi:hypothetical protein
MGSSVAIALTATITKNVTVLRIWVVVIFPFIFAPSFYLCRARAHQRMFGSADSQNRLGIVHQKAN